MRTHILLVVIMRQRLTAGNYALVTVMDDPQRMQGAGFSSMASRRLDMTIKQWEKNEILLKEMRR